MPILLPKHQVAQRQMLRDVRPASTRVFEGAARADTACIVAFGVGASVAFGLQFYGELMDLVILIFLLYFRWFFKKPVTLTFKLPRYADRPDPHNPPPGKTSGGRADGIFYLGNVSDKDHEEYGCELWLTNTDARTHVLYLGTTGSGKTEGLKSMVANALAWGSGFSYTDGKADTDLWASLYAMARRFGRDDDLLILNYMTGNSDDGALSNTMNPFSNGSASYLANMITSFMPDAGGDNAMWKERAVALMFALMPALTYKRDKQGLLLDVGVVRDHVELQPIIKLARDPNLPQRILHGLNGYLHTLPGFVDAAFDDEGNERPPSPDQPMYDLQVARQQHGYLSMQFTRSLQSLADEYGYIFKAQLADIDVLDVVLNRRILIVLIPALEKSGDEAANLGKIVAASLKGMMGATLGNTVEGSWESSIGSKQTHSSSSFMTVFDEVGYYTAPGMATMAAQARSLGFSLVFASQDLPSMEKRVKQEAKSIVGNCNLKILGRIEDPTDTKEFVTRHGGQSWVMETKGMTAPQNTLSNVFMAQPFYDDRQAAYTVRQRVDYDHLRGQREGEAHLIFGDWAVKAQMFHAVPEKSKALRVQRLLPMPGTTKSLDARDANLNKLVAKLKEPEFTAAAVGGNIPASPEIAALAQGAKAAQAANRDPIEIGVMAVASLSGGAAAQTSGADAQKSQQALSSARATNGDANGHSNGQTNGQAKGQSDQYAERGVRREDLPPLSEGDEFSVMEVDQQPAEAHKAAHATGAHDGNGNGHSGMERAPVGLTASDTNTPFARLAADEDEGGGVLETKLPENITAMLQQSAQHLSDGLSGKK